MSEACQAGLPVAVITGAHGGMGVACSRIFGRRYRLILTDRDAQRLQVLGDQLKADGAKVVAAIPGDLSNAATLSEVVQAIQAAGSLKALVHTAGLSTSLGTWDAILDVNLTTTVRLVDAVEPMLSPGAVGVLVASIAGHTARVSPEQRMALDAVLSGGAPALQTLVQATGGEDIARAAYGLSKYGVIRLAERRAHKWAQSGARIVSISPGLISTPMGRKEASAMPEAARLLEATPLGRWGAALDIANVAEFLCSDLAGFITGCDLRVDGGVVGAITSSSPPALRPV